MKQIALSFDLEEFDMPLEYGYSIPFAEQIQVSQTGTKVLLDLLQPQHVQATFFTTCRFALESRELIDRIRQDGHEVGSHAYHHSTFQNSDYKSSRDCLEGMGVEVKGFRMPRMQPVDYELLKNAGYQYDSSLHPIFLPGRYNNYFRRRDFHQVKGLWVAPASTTPVVRIPLFWLSLHHFPLWLYRALCRLAFIPQQYLVLYFHPWEFVDLAGKFGLPPSLTKNTGNVFLERLQQLIDWFRMNDCTFTTISQLVEQQRNAITGGQERNSYG